jgi:acetylornithine deacetylase/succinyl-diaminopimelate desuccinylase-like protein
VGAADADWLAGELEAEGFALERQGYEAAGIAAQNLIVEVPGREAKSQLVVIGAHYDSAAGSPGADDNASGVAAVLALAKRFRKTRPARTLKFAFFSLEEPPHFQTASMGSLVYSRTSAQRGEKILFMLSIESIGYYSNEPGSQRYLRSRRAT